MPPPGETVLVNIEDFEKVLRPELVSTFEQQGYCWVVVGSTQRGRAEAAAEGRCRARWRTTASWSARAKVAHEVSPYKKGAGPVKFNFDWTFDYYPLAYTRPGPEMTIYRLQGGRVRPALSPMSRDRDV